MNEQQRFNLFFTLTKVDLPTRQVWGRATQEVTDAVREICDYATSVPNFEKWSNAAKSRSQAAGLGPEALSLGNVREMHGAKAAGKVIDIAFNNEEKAIDIGTYCGDDSTWEKIRKGILTGFSVGGKYGKRWSDPANHSLIRYTAEPEEVSYVDSPAVPTATYSLVKMDGLSELHKVGDVLPIDIPQPSADNPANTRRDPADGTAEQPSWNNPDPQPGSLNPVRTGQLDKEVPTAAGFPSADLIQPGHTAIEIPGAAPRTDPIAKAAEPEWFQRFSALASQLIAVNKARDEELFKQVEALKAVGERVGITRKDASPLAAPDGFSQNPHDYADPANWSYAYADLDQAQKAIAAFNDNANRDQYSDREWHVLGRRIAYQSGRFGAKLQYSPQLRKVLIEEPPMQKVDAAALLAQLSQGLDVVVDQVGQDPQALRDLLVRTMARIDSAAQSPSAAGTSGSSPSSAPTGSQAGLQNTSLKAASPPSSPSGTPMTTGTGSDPSKAAATGTIPPGSIGSVPTGSSPSSSSSSSSSSSGPSSSSGTPTGSKATGSGGDISTATAPTMTPDVFKGLQDQITQLTLLVTQMAQAQVGGQGTTPPVQKSNPVGDLAALLTVPQPSSDPILETLRSGLPNAYLKAAQLAGSDAHPDFVKVNQLMDREINDSMTPIFTRLMLQHGYNQLGPNFIS